MVNKIYFLVFFLILCFCKASFAQDFPKPTKQFVNDYAGMLSSQEKQVLEHKLNNYFDTTSTQIVVITMKSIGSYDISQYSFDLAEQWGIGEKGKDNGVLLLIAEKERKMQIATGYGVETYLPDIVAGKIIRNILQPAFKRGAYAQGINQATSQMMFLLSGQFEYSRAEGEENRLFGVGSIIFVMMVIFIVYLLSRSNNGGNNGHGGHRSRGGGWTIAPMSTGSGWGNFSGGTGSFGGFGGGSFGGGGASGGW